MVCLEKNNRYFKYKLTATRIITCISLHCENLRNQHKRSMALVKRFNKHFSIPYQCNLEYKELMQNKKN